MKSDEKSVAKEMPSQSVATPFEGLATKRLSRRDLLGQAGQGALGLAMFALLGGGGAALGAPRTRLERLLPGAREIRANGLGKPGTGPGFSALTLGDSTLDLTPSLPMWGDGQNFDQPPYYETLCVGDVDGDGQDELIIRGPAGILVERFDPPTGQWMTLTTGGPQLQDTSGTPGTTWWALPYHYKTIQCVDVDGDGVDEIVGRGNYGLEAYKYDNNPSSPTYQQFLLLSISGAPFSDPDKGGIWQQAAHYSTIKWGKNPSGNGLHFVVGRNTSGIETWYYAEEIPGWFTPNFTYQPWPDTGSADGTNWTLPQYYETIQFADIDGDGRDELLGRSASGLEVWKWDNSISNWAMIYGNGGILGDAGGWDQPRYYSTIQCADIDGDGRKEVIARGASGILAWRYNSSTGEFDQLANGPNWSDASGVWNQPQYYGTIRFGDVDGDGQEEMIARDPSGIQTWKYWNFGGNDSWIALDGNGNGQPAWTDDGAGADANGAKWDQVEYYSTIQFARTHPNAQNYRFWNRNTAPTHDGQGNPRSGPYATLIGRDKYGVQTWRYQQKDNAREDGGYYVRTSAPLPDFSSATADPKLIAAYKALDTVIRGAANASGNIRDTYNSQSSKFPTWMAGLYTMPLGTTYYGPYIPTKAKTPAKIDPFAWQIVTWQIYWEMAYVSSVNDWFGNKMHDFLNTGMLAKGFTAETVGDYMGVPQESNDSVTMDILGVFLGAAGSVLGFPAFGADDNPYKDLPGAFSAISGILSVSMQIAALSDGGSWQGAYTKLKAELINSFSEAATANNDLNQAITGGFISGKYLPGDFGMIAAIGQQIAGAGDYSPWRWPDTTDNVVTSITRSCALGLWQTIIPIAGWFIGYDSDYGPDGQYYVYNPPSKKPAYSVWLANGGLKTQQPAQATLDAIFKSPTNDSDIFPLGVPISDVFEAQNGWPQLGTQDFGGGPIGATPPAPRVFKPDVQCGLVSIKRDAKSGDVLVTASVRNKGLRGATNIAFAEAKAGSSPPLSPLPHRRTRLAAGKSTQVVFHFPGKTGTPGQTVVLRLQGKYKGGSFGGSFRVKLP